MAVFTALLCQADGGAGARDGLCTRHPYGRWKAEEKIAALFCPQPIGLPLCGLATQSKTGGEELQEKNSGLRDVVNAKVPVKLLPYMDP